MKQCVHSHTCDCPQKVKRMEAALRELLQIQGEIHPGWNDEYIPARWVFETVEKALAEPP